VVASNPFVITVITKSPDAPESHFLIGEAFERDFRG